MKQFSLKLDENYQRPVILLTGGLTALLDTGAWLPVWTDEEGVLVKKFGAEVIKRKFPFSGFGGVSYGTLYRANLVVGELIFLNIPIISSGELRTTFNAILSASMFDGLVYQVDTVNHVLNIDIPDNESTIRNIKLMDTKGHSFVLIGKEAEEFSEEDLIEAEILRRGAEVMKTGKVIF